MKKIKLLVTSLLLVLILSVPTTVSANTEVKSQNINVTENFTSIVDEILELKKMSPQLSENEILKVMNERHLKHNEMQERGISDIWNALTNSEKKLCIRYPFDALKVNTARNIAASQTERKFGYSGLGDRSDAFRHGIWNAEMTVLIGKEKAELFATAHEDKDTTGDESDGFSKEAHKEMDLHNNGVGRNIGSSNANLSEDEMADIIYEEIYTSNTEFIWLHD